jgi:hypothetical protein
MEIDCECLNNQLDAAWAAPVQLWSCFAIVVGGIGQDIVHYTSWSSTCSLIPNSIPAVANCPACVCYPYH